MTKRLKTVRISLVLLAALILLVGCIFSEADSAARDTVAEHEADTADLAYESAEEKEEAPLPHDYASIIYKLDGIVMSVYVPNVSATGDNLRNEIVDGLNYQIPSYISFVIVENDRIYISGDVSGVPFQVEGHFNSMSQSGNVLGFNATDILGNFRVIHCAVARNIELSIHYFQVFSNDNPQYHVATKLYLAPHGERDFVVIEIFGDTFPTISVEAINALPEGHSLNLSWYAREFRPSNISVASLEVGRLTINSNGALYTPTMHFLHGAHYFDGILTSVSPPGASFEHWLENNFDRIPILQYSSNLNLQISLQRAFGEIVTGTHSHTVYHDDSTLTAIGIPAEDFTGGTAHVSIPDETGTYLIYVDVKWSGDGNDFALHRYLFKVVR